MQEKAEIGEERSMGFDEEMVDRGSLQFGDLVSGRSELMLGRCGDDTPAFGVARAEVAGFSKPFFGWIAHQENDEIVLRIQKLQCGNGSEIVEIGDDKDEGALAQGGIQSEELFAEMCLFAEFEVAKLMEPEKESFAGEGWLYLEVAGTGGEQAHGRYAIETSQSETAGDLHRELVFRKLGRGESHRSRGVEDEPNGKLLWCLVEFNMWDSGACGDAPIDGLDRVARDVGTGLSILETGAEEGAAVGAVAERVGQALDRDDELSRVERVGVFEGGHVPVALADRGLEDFVENSFGRFSFGKGLVGKTDPVKTNVLGEREEVLGDDVVAALNEGAGSSGFEE